MSLMDDGTIVQATLQDNLWLRENTDQSTAMMDCPCFGTGGIVAPINPRRIVASSFVADAFTGFQVDQYGIVTGIEVQIKNLLEAE